jgi:hypothetical protein
VDQITRDILLERLLISPEKEKFQQDYSPYYGLYDNGGIESFISIGDIYNVDNITKLSMSLNHLRLRERFNAQRDTKVYMCWVRNEELGIITQLLGEEKFQEAKRVLIERVVFV